MLYVLDRILRLFWFLLLGLSALAVLAMGVAIVTSDGPVDASFLTSPVSVEAFESATGASDIVLKSGDRIGIDTVSFTSSDPALVWPMVIVLVLFALAEVFSRGVELQQENDLTV